MKKKQFISVFFLLFVSYFTVSQTAPIANNDSYSTFVNTALNTIAPGILDNDVDKDGDLKVTRFLINGVAFSVGQTACFDHGTMTIFEDGSFTFVPSQYFKGNLETIIYIISDGKFTSYANINISVTKAPEPPIANNDNYNTFVNTTLNQTAPGILENDTDADADDLKVTEFLINGDSYNVGQTANFNQGSITILEDGSFSFIPLTDFIGDIDTITYTITDGTFTSSANVTISVIIPPSPPIANNDNYELFSNTTLTESAPGILRNDTDEDGDVLKVTQFLISGVTYNVGQTATFPQGKMTIFEDGSFVFIPSTDFNGVFDSIFYTITDGLFTSTANIIISVIIPPTPPIAIDDYNTADENKTLVVPSPGVLINDTDVNQDVITVTEFLVNGTIYAVGQTANLAEGDFTMFPDGSYTLVATPNYIGEVPVINYTITDGVFTSTANLFLTIEPTENLLEIRAISSCNQGFTSSGNYKIRYDAILTNRSNAKDYHAPSLITNINLTNDLQAIFGTGCLIEVDEVSIRNDNIPIEDYLGQPYPREFTNNAINPNFLNGTSNNFFSDEAVNNLTLYPRQSIYISYCVTVNAFCDERPNPTPSGSGLDFTNTLNITDSSGGSTNFLTLKDFHTTEAVVSAALYVPEFNNTQVNPPGTANPNGTFDYTNTVIITNEGSAAANNVNFNMGLQNFITTGITFNDILITQVSGPTVTINPDFDGVTNTNLLTNNNNLPAGETIRLEVYFLIDPISNSRYSFFSQINTSQTQGILDGFDESLTNIKRAYSFVT